MASISQVVATPDVHGPSYTRPPFFYGTDYAYWRNKVEMFLASECVNLWKIIEKSKFFIFLKKPIHPPSWHLWIGY